MSLATATATQQLEIALQQFIAFAMRARLATVANVAALRAVATVDLNGGSTIADEITSLVPVTAEAVCFLWDGYNLGTDDGVNVIQPTDRPASGGRWLRTTAALTGGYLQAVRIYQGETTLDEITAKLLGQAAPAVLVKWIEDDHRYGGGDPGGVYKYVPTFELWASSKNLRADNSALIGSRIATEAAADPGVHRIIGDLKVLFAGPNLGIDSVDFCQIGKSSPVLQQLSERRFIHKLVVKVYATLQNPDLDDVTPSEMTLQPTIGQLDASADNFDPANYVISGLTVPVASGLTQTVAAGEAIILGVDVTPTATANTFTASSTTYRDLSNTGAWAFVTVPLGEDEPAVTANSLRIGVTTTDANNVTDDYIVAATRANLGNPMIVFQS